MGNPSPLRYPGGKYKISRLIELLVNKSGDNCSVYVEPFAGGAGIAIDLLLRDIVSEIVINDSDPAIYSVWKAIVQENDAFIDMLHSTPVSLDEWKRQREIYLAGKKYSLEYGFATFFLNRTNHSGILASGPIGGMGQGAWKLDVRYPKDDLSKKIEAIGQKRKQIHVFNRDVESFISRQLKQFEANAFVYFDPPYYRKGKDLYQNFFDEKKHQALCSKIKADVKCPWIVSYDDVPQICKIYKGLPCRKFTLNYSLANNGNGKEVMFFGRKELIPTMSEVRRIGMDRLFI